jgi:hypothetical protein
MKKKKESRNFGGEKGKKKIEFFWGHISSVHSSFGLVAVLNRKIFIYLFIKF